MALQCVSLEGISLDGQFFFQHQITLFKLQSGKFLVRVECDARVSSMEVWQM